MMRISNSKFLISNVFSVKRQASSVKYFFTLIRYTLYAIRLPEVGFTLIELLVTMGVIVIVGSILFSIVVSTLRVSSKTTVLSDIKQNGDSAISQMARTLRSAVSVTTPTCSATPQNSTAITVTQADNSQTTYDCSTNTITANTVSILDTNAVMLVPKTCSITCTRQSSADYPVIQIQFTLQQANTSTANEKSASVPFQTSVTLRNLQQ